MHKQIVYEKQDLTWLSWSKIRNSSGTAGSFLKAYSDLGGEKTYYKLSNYDAVKGIIGHECINEVIADRLLTILGIEHLSYLDAEAVERTQVLEDKPVQCFVGSRSAWENLKLIPAGQMPKLNWLSETDRDVLFEGLEEVMPWVWRDKIWEMLWKRWKCYEDFCNQR